ncbi:sulfurtransferase TusA [Pseudomonadales bacterium]|nr:sulfurtransferase TusA [Pseudomonadales bacterium]MDB4090538.1 sulfurtransferase TusA [Pseudomonadales bacterium]MDB4362761.1 sulfurtransferase TusA [Pseudomonadales bacterium]MDB4630947.1 sulfurtransferase TusA [Pseudomonadales bacterium]
MSKKITGEPVDHDHEIDARGLLCPEPVMMLHKKIRAIAAGETIRLVATDSSTERDVPRFCEFLRHPLMGRKCIDGHYLYWIKKRDA